MKLTGNAQELLQEIAQKPPSYDALMIALTEQYDIVNKKSHVIDNLSRKMESISSIIMNMLCISTLLSRVIFPSEQSRSKSANFISHGEPLTKDMIH
jgi:hypothetical protein